MPVFVLLVALFVCLLLNIPAINYIWRTYLQVGRDSQQVRITLPIIAFNGRIFPQRFGLDNSV